ncbi:hypothetical protein Glove_149g48 [Diversispora epigaea]|uniref:Eisosome component PIL1-domain-containing protein n=1 Tax=Diversispora epigaea TaxID=1348612 RepID=A0A397J212_9GLOM|nr:hypothetical protein Glove_149g48 [Diversispora epigaea]
MSNLQIPTNSNERQGSIIDSFKNLNLDNISHGVRRNLTQVDPRLPKDIKNIILLVKEERNVLTSLQNAASEKKEASMLLQLWGKEMGEDLTDITEKVSDLVAKISDTEQVFTEKYAHYRNLLKEIRTAEESLIPSRERKRKINEEIQKIQKSHPKSPRIPELEADLAHVNRESVSVEVEVGNTIRKKLKAALRLLFEAMFESSEKISIISGFGWDVVGQIDETPCKSDQGRPQYSGGEITQQAIKDCQVALLRWQPTSSDIRPLLPALTNTAPAALAAQKQEYEAKQNQLKISMNTLKETHDSQINKYNEKLNEQKETYETRINEFITELTAQKGGFEAQLNDLSSALSTEKQMAEQKINEVNAALTAQKEKYESERETFEAKSKEMLAALDAQRKQYEAQLKQYSVLMTTNQEYEAALKERDAIISKLQENVSSVATERNKLNNVVKDLEETLKSKSTTIDQKEDKVGKLEDEISNIKNQLSELKFSAPINTDQLSDPGHRSINTSSNESGITGEAAYNPANPTNPANPANPANPMGGGYMYQPQYGMGYQSQPPFNQYQQQFYNPGQPPYGYQPTPSQPPSSQPSYGYQPTSSPPQQPFGYQPTSAPLQQQQQQPTGPPAGFAGGFWNMDDAPPAYDGPKNEYPEDKKS